MLHWRGTWNARHRASDEKTTDSAFTLQVRVDLRWREMGDDLRGGRYRTGDVNLCDSTRNDFRSDSEV